MHFFEFIDLFLMCQRFIMGVKGLNKVSQKKFSSLVWCKISGTYRILPSCWSCLWTLLCWCPWHSQSLFSDTPFHKDKGRTEVMSNIYLMYTLTRHLYLSLFLSLPSPILSCLEIQLTFSSLGKSLQGCTGPLKQQMDMCPGLEWANKCQYLTCTQRTWKVELWPCKNISALLSTFF